MRKLLFTCIFLTFTIHANFQLETTADHNGTTRTLQSGDIAFSGDGIQFHFRTNTVGTLTITTNTKKNIYTKTLAKDTAYTFPQESLIVLDDNTGLETFTFIFNNKMVKAFELNHIERKVSPRKYTKVSDEKKTTMPVIDFPIFEDRKYTDLSKVKSNTRSATDKKIYKALTSSTIIIKANNALGAGVLINTAGHFLTNWHIVQNNPYVYVAFKPNMGNKPNKNNYYAAKIIQTDPIKDLALIQILNNDVIVDKNTKPIQLAQIKNIEPGEDIYTVGHPVGYYYSMSSGIIGNVLNDHTWEAKDTQHKADYIIKTQNQISGGNSGGPLVDKNLQLLGLMTYSDTKGQNLNFAVSVEDIKQFLENKSQAKYTLAEHQTVSSGKRELSFPLTGGNSMQSDTTDAEDTKGNPIVIHRLDTNHNGIFDTIMIDTNNDGIWNKIGYDKDEDGIIEKWSNF